ncbi:glycogen/starch synthase, partial [Priestia megaterium]|uniref:glycogen/starch synthase n=1 Tax=Priestia megaterium TaxID=1404 RepID=UPI00164994CE
HSCQLREIFPKTNLYERLNLNDCYFTTTHLQFYRNINFMKASLVSPHKITTLTPTYPHQIQIPYYPQTLDGLLR